MGGEWGGGGEGMGGHNINNHVQLLWYDAVCSLSSAGQV